ncbi:MAG: fucose isomerase [Candidatus Glassbacteria bacterium]|nr:fucose isomerase [Candidatus Glassbacteria bacterium]
MLNWTPESTIKNELPAIKPSQVILVANGDRRRTANLACQAAQLECERQLREVFTREGYELVRAHPELDPSLGHGFIETQAQGREIFARIPAEAPLVVAEAVWQYSNHVVYNLWEHRGPILVASNFDGNWPGLVGALGLESCLTRHRFTENQAGHSLIWSSEKFEDDNTLNKIRQWLAEGKIDHDTSHVRKFDRSDFDGCDGALDFGAMAADAFRSRPRLLGLYDPLCMGMINAAFDERDMVGTGIQLRRLNQSDLYARMLDVPRGEAMGCVKWLVDKGFKLEIGSNPFTDITEKAVLDSGRMYTAIVRHVAEEGLDGVGIAYQLGLAKLCAASDLVEAMLNSTARPPVQYMGTEVMAGEPIMCANEADMGCAVDQAFSREIYRGSGLEPLWWETTQHDIRWGALYCGPARFAGTDFELDAFVWAFELSGNTPAGHVAEGWAGMEGVRQPYEFFTENGICTRCLAKPGELIWSRIFLDREKFCIDIGRGAAVELPEQESRRRWQSTTEEWPLMHAMLYGVSRDQLMARHKSNHITVSYAPDAESATEIALAKAAMAESLGFRVALCGEIGAEGSLEKKLAGGEKIRGPGES